MIYQVYEAEVNNAFALIGEVLLDSDRLDECVVMCSELALKCPTQRFVVWQERLHALRQNCCELDDDI